MHLTKININRFRSVRPRTELEFNRTINVVLGKNGTGKTTLLTLLASIIRYEFSSFAAEHFDIDFSLVADLLFPHEAAKKECRISVALKNVPYFPADATLQKHARVTFEQSARVRIDGADGTVVNIETTGAASKIDGATPKHVPPLPPLHSDYLQSVVYAATGGLLIGAPFAYRYDEALGMFQLMTRGPQARVTITRRNDAVVEVSRGFVPEEITNAIRTRGQDDRNQIVVRGDIQIAGGFLSTITRILGFEDVELRAELAERTTAGEMLLEKYANFSFLFSMGRGLSIIHEQLSYGQKRLLSFYYYCASNSGPVVADELVNGLHYSWIEYAIDTIADRQAFLTSQNPLLFDYLVLDSEATIEKMFVSCTMEADDGRKMMSWQHLNRDMARRLYSAHTTGIEHFGDILRTRGLW